MSTNSEEMVKEIEREIREAFETLLRFAFKPSEEEAPSAYEMEGDLFRRLLALGPHLMELYSHTPSRTLSRSGAFEFGGKRATPVRRKRTVAADAFRKDSIFEKLLREEGRDGNVSA